MSKIYNEQIPVGKKINGVTVVKPQTELKDICNEGQIFDGPESNKKDLTLGQRILKEYAEDKVRTDMRYKMQHAFVTEDEEDKIAEKLWEARNKDLDNEPDADDVGDKPKKCDYETQTVKNAKPRSFNNICQEIAKLHEKKNNDYGNAADASYREFGIVSYVIRLNDKMNRLKTLTKPGAKQLIKCESIEDTLMDLAAYAIMAIESLRN